jgi:hypothetical protein
VPLPNEWTDPSPLLDRHIFSLLCLGLLWPFPNCHRFCWRSISAVPPLHYGLCKSAWLSIQCRPVCVVGARGMLQVGCCFQILSLKLYAVDIARCRQQCIWGTVERLKQRGQPVPQFHGKWPFLPVTARIGQTFIAIQVSLLTTPTN